MNQVHEGGVKARENVCEWITLCFGFTSDWSKSKVARGFRHAPPVFQFSKLSDWNQSKVRVLREKRAIFFNLRTTSDLNRLKILIFFSSWYQGSALVRKMMFCELSQMQQNVFKNRTCWLWLYVNLRSVNFYSIGRIYFGRRIIRLRRIMRLFKINMGTHKKVVDE